MVDKNFDNDGKPRSCPVRPYQPVQGETVDPAVKSLADALRVSFRLLSALMVLFVVLFLATGIESIEEQEQGIIKVFGRIVGVAKNAGFVYNWPFPVGQIEKVSTQERRLLIDEFWMFESARDKLKPLAQRSRQNQGLRPGWDGYLLTSDRNLIHIQLVCAYRVQDPVAFKTHIRDLDPTMRAVLCQAAIHAAATRTADAIQADPTAFRRQVRRLAQAELDRLLRIEKGQAHGIRITDMVLPRPDAKIWPLAAFNAYEAAQRAKSEKLSKIEKAKSDAREMTRVIGAKHFIELAGEPWNLKDEQERTRAGTYEGEDYNLIGQLSNAQDELDAAGGDDPKNAKKIRALQEKVDELWKNIDSVLTRTTTGGEASMIIARAESAKTRIIQQSQKRANNFVKLHAEYKKAPQVFLEKTWAAALDEVLNEPTNIKWYLRPGRKGMVVYLNNDPNILKQIRDYLLKEKQQTPTGP